MNVPFLQTATFTGLVSTDEYYTSQEWKEAYDDSQVLYTNVVSNSANWDIAYNIATFYAQNSAILIEQTTFSELTSLKANNQLKPGQFYQINDFQLLWWNIDSTNTTLLSSETVEPLLVLALSSNSISHEAFSTLHPEDIVYYDIDARTSTTWNAGLSDIPNFKGWIYRRIDRLNNIDICWDWRYITNNCCRFNLDPIPIYDAGTTYNRTDVVKTASNKLYISIVDSNLNNSLTNDAWWKPATEFSDDSLPYYPTTESLENQFLKDIFSVTPILSSRTGFPTFCDNNLTPTQTDIISRGIKNIKIKAGSSNMIFIQTTPTAGFGNTLRNIEIGESSNNNIFAGTIEDISFGSGFAGNCLQTRSLRNIRVGDDCQGNFFNLIAYNVTIGDRFSRNHVRAFGRFYDNIISNTCQRNFFKTLYSIIIGNQMTDNTFVGDIYLSKIGENFKNNIVESCFGCNIGNNFQFNNIDGGAFSFNNIGNNCSNNTIGEFCSYNNIANNFSSNTIGTFFLNNIVANEFIQNTIGDNCTYNNISNSFLNNIIEQNFTKTNVNNEIQNINFTGATHVYNNYDKNIFKNFDSVVRLSYFNSNDQLVVTDPTA